MVWETKSHASPVVAKGRLQNQRAGKVRKINLELTVLTSYCNLKSVEVV